MNGARLLAALLALVFVLAAGRFLAVFARDACVLEDLTRREAGRFPAGFLDSARPVFLPVFFPAFFGGFFLGASFLVLTLRALKVSTNWPSLILSPSLRGVTPVMRLPLINVPFVERSSLILNADLFHLMDAWVAEIVPDLRGRLLLDDLPIVNLLLFESRNGVFLSEERM